MSTTFVVDEAELVRIPDWVEDLESFRRWALSDEFPETGRICYLDGEVWVDMSKEQIFSHNQVRHEFGFKLTGVIKASCPGRFFPDGVLLSNTEANLTAQPDGIFASERSLRTGRVRLVEGAEEGYLELEGSPDMVLEVISASSVGKDTERLRELYWRAAIREYWLVDARGERLEFDILRHSPKGYITTRKQAGWIKSAVFKKSFRLTRRIDALGPPDYILAVR
jgi:Uma2 family endonuclease